MYLKTCLLKSSVANNSLILLANSSILANSVDPEELSDLRPHYLA